MKKEQKINRHRAITLEEWAERYDGVEVHGKMTIEGIGRVTARFRCGEQEVVGRIDRIDSHSPRQMKVRVGWRNLQNAYIMAHRAIKGLWEAKKGEKRKPDSAFMSANLKWMKEEDLVAALSRREAEQYGCVVLPWQVSDGSLKPIRVTDGVSSMRVGRRFAISEETTIAELTAAMIIGSKGRWREGDVLTYVELVQTEMEVPRGNLRWGMMVLDLQDERAIWKTMPRSGLVVKNGYLAHESKEASGYSWIKSREVKGNWHHSSQRLVVEGNEELVARYGSEEKREEVAREYGGKERK